MKGISSISLFLTLLCCFVNLVFSEGSVGASSDQCTDDTIKAALSGSLPDIGKLLIQNYGSVSNGFVYSDLKIVHQLLKLFALGSRDARAGIKDYLGLPKNDTCDEKFCHSFNNIIDAINTTLGSNFDYESTLYYEKTKVEEMKESLRESFSECGGKKGIDFRRDKKQILPILNKDYQQMMKTNQVKCVKTALNDRTFFFLMSGLRLDSGVFGKVMSYESKNKFTDFGGQEHDVQWLGTEGEFWVGASELPISSQHASKKCLLKMFRTEINNGDQYMLYFTPTFKGITDVAEKINYFKYFFANFRAFVKKAIDKISIPIENYPQNFTTLLFPVIDINTEVDLKASLETVLDELFKSGQITDLYQSLDTLKDMRTCDYFTNKVENHDEGTLPAEDQLRFLNSPFVFTLVDKKTGISLKTGAYFRP